MLRKGQLSSVVMPAINLSAKLYCSRVISLPSSPIFLVVIHPT
jgi:hypothetical protein